MECILIRTYYRVFSKFETISFNHSNSRKKLSTKFIFTGDTLAVVYDGKYYNFILDQRTKESEDSYIEGKI